MIIAWLGCVSIAIIMARHYKNAWPDSTLCGVKIWFAVNYYKLFFINLMHFILQQIHRALMLMSVILIIAASIMIIIDRKGWSGVSLMFTHLFFRFFDSLNLHNLFVSLKGFSTFYTRSYRNLTLYYPTNRSNV
jgi:hypothetical protein